MRHSLILLCGVLLAGTCLAREVAPAPAPPPPPMDLKAPPLEAAPPGADPASPPPGAPPAGNLTIAPPPESAPTVSIRQEKNGDTVEEYRQNGQITMVKVTPKVGIPYTMMDTNGDGRLDRNDSDGPVGPVYYTLYEWN